ncbi:MAG: tetratricopeptide repeat protein [Bacteroidota bacterium]
MKPFIWTFILLLYCTIAALPATLDTAKANRIRHMTIQGLEMAYNLDLDGADKLFDEAQAIEPLHPRPMLGKASIRFWRLMIQHDDGSYDRFVDEMDNVIDTSEHYRDHYDTDADIYTCLGTAYAYRAFAHARMKSYLKAAWDGKKSYDYFNDALQMDRNAYDAYVGVGIFHYFATFMPKALQYLVAILGVPGDSERGLKEIGITAQKGIFSNVESKFCLAELLPWYNENFDSSEVMIKQLVAAYPANSLFSFTLAVWQIRRNDVAEARDILQKISREEHLPIPNARHYIDYKLAECYFRLEEYGHAQECYERFLQNYHDEVYVATANYRIGVCMDMLGKKSEAENYYKIAADSKSKFGDDRYSSRRAAALLKRSLGSDDSVLISAQNLSKSSRYDKALELLARLKISAPSLVRTEVMYRIGETYYDRGSYGEALKSFQDVLSQHLPKSEEWMFPWAYYYSAMCDVKLGNKIEAKKFFEKTTDYDDYDFEHWLSYRTKRELERLNK